MLRIWILSCGLLVGPPAFSEDPPDSFRSYQAHLAAAEKSLRLGEMLDLRRWLDGAPQEHRGWEWHHLQALSDTSLRSFDISASRLVFAPNGETMATIEGDRVVLRDWPQLDPIGTLEGHNASIYRAEFSPDGTRMVTVSRDVTSRVWNLEDHREVSRIDLANPAVAAATFSPDGKLCATCAWERVDGKVFGVVWIWSATTGEVLARVRAGIKPLSSISFTPDGTRIVVASWDGIVHVLDTSGTELEAFELPDLGVYTALDDLDVSPDGTKIAVASKDRTVHVFDLASGEQIQQLRGHVHQVNGVRFSPDGARLLSSSVDATMRVWSVVDGSEVATLRGHRGTVRSAAWRTATEISSASRDGSVRLWEIDSPGGPEVSFKIEESPYSATFSPDGKFVALACFDGTIRLHDAAHGTELANWQAHVGKSCHGAAFDAAGERLITCSWDETARIWDVATRRSIAVLGAGAGVYACDISPAGDVAALTAKDAQIWSVDDPRLLHRITREAAGARRIRFSPDGAQVAVGWSDGSAAVYSVAGGAAVAEFAGDGNLVETVVFSPDGASLLTGDAGGKVRRYSIADGSENWTCATGGGGIKQIEMMGDRVAACGDRVLWIDAKHGEIVLERHLFRDSAWHLSWSPDGQRLASCCSNGEVAIVGVGKALRAEKKTKEAGLR